MTGAGWATAERIDLPALAAAFGRALRLAGIPVTPARSARFAQALSLTSPLDRGRVYWSARAVLVSGRDQLPIFDRVFAGVFGELADQADWRGDRSAADLRRAEVAQRRAREAPAVEPTGAREAVPGGRQLVDAGPSGESDAGDDQRATELPLAAAGDIERLGERDFARLEPDELRALARLMARLALAPPPRRSRRTRLDPHGDRIDVRATLRAARGTGGDPVSRLRRSRLERPRRLVVLCDVSGSMEPYARAYLQLLHAAVGGSRAEAFVFATRLTRVTRALRGRQPDLAIERAAAAARDWAGGTRLGASLQRFNDEHGRRGMARGAVVVIVSDGWERGDPALVAREMERLRRLAHRIVWVNPRRAAPGYEPLAGGMAAALPFCDEFLSGHSMRALSAVADAIAAGRISGRRPESAARGAPSPSAPS